MSALHPHVVVYQIQVLEMFHPQVQVIPSPGVTLPQPPPPQRLSTLTLVLAVRHVINKRIQYKDPWEQKAIVNGKDDIYICAFDLMCQRYFHCVSTIKH